MTRKVGNTVLIEETPPEECQFCGVNDELRPYGPNNEWICFDCAMKDEPTALKKFRELIEGPGEKPQ